MPFCEACVLNSIFIFICRQHRTTGSSGSEDVLFEFSKAGGSSGTHYIPTIPSHLHFSAFPPSCPGKWVKEI